MAFTHSFQAVTPFARYDGVSWTRALVEESANGSSGWSQIATPTIPTDPTPDTANPVNITVTTAALAAGYYRFRFDTGASSATSPYTGSVYSPATGTSTADLCTLADVKSFLRITDTSSDTVLSSLITPASTEIMKWTEREFAPASTATRQFLADRVNDELLVDLAPYDVQSLSAVSIDADQTTPYVLSVDEWRLRPRPNTDGVYQSVKLVPFGLSTGRVLWQDRTVSLTGTWGFPAIPSGVKQATILTVGIWSRQDLGAFGPSLLADTSGGAAPSVFPAAPGQIPPGVKKLLAPWKRWGC